MTSTWTGMAIFAALLGVGLAVMTGGIIVVFRALAARPKVEPRLAAQPDRPPVATPPALFAEPERRDALTPGAAARADDFQDDVPTAVFRPSDYKDIEALMQDADKYVTKKKQKLD